MPKSENTPPVSPRTIKRRDATGHLDPKYERDLLEEARNTPPDAGNSNAFLVTHRTGEPLSEEFGESFVQSATTGGESELERQDSVVSEEQGGPFVTSTAEEEFANGTDASNIAEATREPLPKTSKAGP